MKIKLIAALILTAVATNQAFAYGTTTYHGATGGYLGSSSTYGGTTTYHGATGGYLGSSSTYGGTTTYHGATGRYLGSSSTYGW